MKRSITHRCKTWIGLGQHRKEFPFVASTQPLEHHIIRTMCTDTNPPALWGVLYGYVLHTGFAEELDSVKKPSGLQRDGDFNAVHVFSSTNRECQWWGQ